MTGIDALANNVAGYANTADGYYALNRNTTGAAKTAVGSKALVQQQQLKTLAKLAGLVQTLGDKGTAHGVVPALH